MYLTKLSQSNVEFKLKLVDLSFHIVEFESEEFRTKHPGNVTSRRQ
jgi:hypothetical protein